ncbi:XK-related protein 9 [Engraulis encrasicolus]|uniref:XK-related protein 9 n=1 Tax=Engraulis encrasicolus TaxID=184585 RepID=UPI002FD02B63
MYTKDPDTWPTGGSEEPLPRKASVCEKKECADFDLCVQLIAKQEAKECEMNAQQGPIRFTKLCCAPTVTRQPGSTEFTKVRWVLTVIGLVLYVVDIASDVVLAAKYLCDGQMVWAVLTVVFVLSASVCTQIFSYRWFRDDKAEESRRSGGEQVEESCVPWGLIRGLHIMQMGIFTRYFQLLRRSFCVVRSKSVSHSNDEVRPKSKSNSKSVSQEEHLQLFRLATDLSMLRLFEAFLESVPQLLLQLYIALLGHGHLSVFQYVSMVASFLSVSWAMVDWRRCHRHSRPDLRKMTGVSTVVYLLYKFLTISVRLFSLSLLLAVTPCNLLPVGLTWVLATAWAAYLNTDFCTSRALEWLYRGVVGVVLVFSFFNVKGSNTRLSMALYYALYCLQSVTAPLQLYLSPSPHLLWLPCLPVLAAILGGLSVGLALLGLYYGLLHPPQKEEEKEGENGERRVPDEVDGVMMDPVKTAKE